MNHNNYIPPQCIDIEQSILSTLLLDPEKSLDILDLLIVADDFYKSGHQKIYKTMIQMKSFDLTTLVNKLRDNKIIEEIGGAVYLSKLIDSAPIASDLKEYALILKEKSLLRKTLNALHSSITSCHESTDSPSITVDNIQQKILEISSNIVSSDILPAKEIFKKVINTMEHPEHTVKIKTGFPTIDYMLNVAGGKLIIIAGRPSMGKSSFKRNIIANISKQGIISGCFSLEMNSAADMYGFIAQETGIETMNLYNPQKLDHIDWEKIMDFPQHNIDQWPVLFDDSSPLLISELRRKARLMVKKGCKIIFIDQLNKVKSGQKLDRFSESTECTIEIAQLANELKIPIILLAQLNRELEKRSDKRPVLSDLKNTGSLEEEADAVLLLFRKYYYTNSSADKSTGEIILAKNRGGKTGLIECNWDEKRMLFLERSSRY